MQRCLWTTGHVRMALPQGRLHKHGQPRHPLLPMQAKKVVAARSTLRSPFLFTKTRKRHVRGSDSMTCRLATGKLSSVKTLKSGTLARLRVFALSGLITLCGRSRQLRAILEAHRRPRSFAMRRERRLGEKGLIGWRPWPRSGKANSFYQRCSLARLENRCATWT